MSFENAGVSKGSFLDYFPFQRNSHQNQGLIVTFALTSIFAGVFDIKHYFHLQVSKTPGIVLYTLIFVNTLVCTSYIAAPPGNAPYDTFQEQQRV